MKQTLEYNKDKGTISLCTYSDDGFLESELDITDKVTTLVKFRNFLRIIKNIK